MQSSRIGISATRRGMCHQIAPVGKSQRHYCITAQTKGLQRHYCITAQTKGLRINREKRGKMGLVPSTRSTHPPRTATIESTNFLTCVTCVT